MNVQSHFCIVDRGVVQTADGASWNGVQPGIQPMATPHIVTATGKARCCLCVELIEKDTQAVQIQANSRAAPFFHVGCLERLARLAAQPVEI